MTFYNPHAKLRLSTDDLPKDIEVLVESIRQYIDALLPKAEDFLIPDLNLTRAERLRVYQIACGKQLTNALRKNTETKHLSNIRKKLSAYHHPIYISRGTGDRDFKPGNYMEPEDKKRLIQLIIDNSGSQEDIANLRTLLPFDPYDFNEAKLPKTIPELQDILLKLIELIRGNPEAITLPAITSSSEKVILSTLLAKKTGCASSERLFLSIYPPFATNPALDCTVDVFIYRLRSHLKECGIYIQTYINRGYGINDENRDKLFALMETPFIPVIPPQSDSAYISEHPHR